MSSKKEFKLNIDFDEIKRKSIKGLKIVAGTAAVAAVVGGGTYGAIKAYEHKAEAAAKADSELMEAYSNDLAPEASKFVVNYGGKADTTKVKAFRTAEDAVHAHLEFKNQADQKVNCEADSIHVTKGTAALAGNISCELPVVQPVVNAEKPVDALGK